MILAPSGKPVVGDCGVSPHLAAASIRRLLPLGRFLAYRRIEYRPSLASQTGPVLFTPAVSPRPQPIRSNLRAALIDGDSGLLKAVAFFSQLGYIEKSCGFLRVRSRGSTNAG